MRLQAISAGTGVPSDRFTGVVHSVFRRACNIRTDDRGLLALLAPELGNVPHGIRVEAPVGLAFADHVRVGQRVGCRAAVLRIADSELAVDLSTALIWRSELAGLRVDLSRPAVASAWQVAWRASQRRRHSDHDPLSGTICGRGMVLADASRALDPERAAAAVRALIGCGPGLTPAGDDLIVGLLAGLFAGLGDDPAKRRFLHHLGAAVSALAAGTGEISRSYLRHATLGSIAEPLARLAGAIAAGRPAAEVELAADQALEVGHTSGGDGVFGLLLGLESWSHCEPGHG
jgi:Protein of unknown function (DUF2877)